MRDEEMAFVSIDTSMAKEASFQVHPPSQNIQKGVQSIEKFVFDFKLAKQECFLLNYNFRKRYKI